MRNAALLHPALKLEALALANTSGNEAALVRRFDQLRILDTRRVWAAISKQK
jgi:hypothetical protein